MTAAQNVAGVTAGFTVRTPPSANPTSGCLHLVSAWATEYRLILGQEAVADGSHEIAAIPELLKVLGLKGALVSTDAAGCHKATASHNSCSTSRTTSPFAHTRRAAWVIGHCSLCATR